VRIVILAWVWAGVAGGVAGIDPSPSHGLGESTAHADSDHSQADGLRCCGCQDCLTCTGILLSGGVPAPAAIPPALRVAPAGTHQDGSAGAGRMPGSAWCRAPPWTVVSDRATS